jgi:hypothetical protein
METLAAFVRERARWKEPKVADKSDYLLPPVTRSDEEQSTPEPATDITAVLAVIVRRPKAGRLREEQGGREWRFDLRATDLRDVNLCMAHLDGAEGLTQPQIDAAYGDAATELPEDLTRPEHWGKSLAE